MECLPASAACVLCTLADWIENTRAPFGTSWSRRPGVFFDKLHELANESVSGTDAEAHVVIDHALADLAVYGFDRAYINSTWAKEQVEQGLAYQQFDKRYTVRALRRAARLSSSRGQVLDLS